MTQVCLVLAVLGPSACSTHEGDGHTGHEIFGSGTGSSRGGPEKEGGAGQSREVSLPSTAQTRRHTRCVEHGARVARPGPVATRRSGRACPSVHRCRGPVCPARGADAFLALASSCAHVLRAEQV